MKKLWWFIGLVFLIVLVILALNLIPARGTIRVKTENIRAIPTIGVNKYQGEYFEVDYPSNFELREIDEAKNLESVMFLVDRGSDRVTIVLNQPKSLEENSGVIWRRSREEYAEEKRMVGEKEWLVFAKEGEVTGYWWQEGKLLSVAVTANTNDFEAIEKLWLAVTEKIRLK